MNTVTPSLVAGPVRAVSNVRAAAANPDHARLDYLDATRAFALVLGVIFHASISFSPYFMGWAVQDVSTSAVVADFVQLSHSFRMETFFLLAGFFSFGLLQRRGLGEFLRSRAFRLGIPFAAGWFVLRPLVVSGWIMGAASLRGDFDFWRGVRSGFESLKTLPAGLFTGSHLWFLYYLMLITTLTLVLRAVVGLFTREATKAGSYSRWPRGVDATVAWVARSPWALGMLVPPTAVALWYMRFWGMDTPDQTLLPNLPVLAIYGGCFGLGWLFARQPVTIANFGRLSLTNLLLALGSGWAVLRLSGVQADPSDPHYVAAHVGFVVAYATLMWTLVSLTLGFFRKFLDRPNAIVRYIADSSYWMYLVHLPVVVWLQVAVAELNAPWWLKLAGVSLATVAVSLISYDLLVRPTFLGMLLNGRRKDRVLLRQSQE